MSFYGSFVSPLAAPIVIIDFRPASNSFAGKLFRMVCAALLWIGIRPCTAACLRLRVRVCARLADFEQKKSLLVSSVGSSAVTCTVSRLRATRNQKASGGNVSSSIHLRPNRWRGSVLSIYAIPPRKASGNKGAADFSAAPTWISVQGLHRMFLRLDSAESPQRVSVRVTARERSGARGKVVRSHFLRHRMCPQGAADR